MILVDPNQDWYELQIGDVKFLLSPLTWGQKQAAVASSSSMEGGERKVNMCELAFRVVKYSVKELMGVTSANNEPFKLSHEKKDFDNFRGSKVNESVLTDACAESLITGLVIEPSMETLSYQLLSGIPNEITDKEGKVIKGVKIKLVGKPSPEKKKKK